MGLLVVLFLAWICVSERRIFFSLGLVLGTTLRMRIARSTSRDREDVG
jgi:hypothetical protein